MALFGLILLNLAFFKTPFGFVHAQKPTNPVPYLYVPGMYLICGLGTRLASISGQLGMLSSSSIEETVLPDREQSSQICELFTLYMNFFWTLKICELFVNFLKYYEQFHELWYFHFSRWKCSMIQLKNP